jgi:hypothetical protein
VTVEDVLVALDALEDGTETAWALQVLEAAGVLHHAWPMPSHSPRRRWRGSKGNSRSGAWDGPRSQSSSTLSLGRRLPRSLTDGRIGSFSGVGTELVSQRASESQRCATSSSGVGFLGRLEWV